MKKNPDIQRLRLDIYGAVQGMGFRPFAHNLANDLGLRGWIRNSSQGATVEVEGKPEDLRLFRKRLEEEKPSPAFFHNIQAVYLDPAGHGKFEILTSGSEARKTAWILPDLATCRKCGEEIFDENNRRYLYPFTNCTHCGPRYSIIERLPYDRQNTSMKRFKMCKACREEYGNPYDRRFHAQPNACAECGPRVEVWDSDGKVLGAGHEALVKAAGAIEQGETVAVKGLGGFHLMFDASRDEAVCRLRRLKHREEKPLALMFRDLDEVERCCFVSGEERLVLQSPASPIVLLKKRPECGSLVTPSVAPGNPCLGVMLAYTPLHLILFSLLRLPLGATGATSANLSDEPICIGNLEAIERLRGIAGLFLVHDRPIVRHVDDSIVRLMAGRPMVLRRSRGYAPLPVTVKHKAKPVLALGAHLKNTAALGVEDNIFISQHIGDLETDLSFKAFVEASESLIKMYEITPALIACDAHPGYFSTLRADGYKIPVKKIQHHHAHIVSCMAENRLEGPVCGIAFDGTGYGLDGTIWGGEILEAGLGGFSRKGCLRAFFLIGGDKAVKEPRRSAAGLLLEVFGGGVWDKSGLACFQAFSEREKRSLRQAAEKGVNTVKTSSCGRLFDGVASLLGICHVNNFEGQAAMALEYLCYETEETKECYSFGLVDTIVPPLKRASGIEPGFVIDWIPTVEEIVGDISGGVPVEKIAVKFHNTIVEMIVASARKTGLEKVVLSGGCFQNKYVTEKAVARLTEDGLVPYWHQTVPPNDGGIALGQAVAAGSNLILKGEASLQSDRLEA